MIFLHTREVDSDEVYRVFTRLVVPRPIAWISTVSPEGIKNLAPFSFFNAVCDEPPIVIVSISRRDDGRRKDTTDNILRTGEFVINLVSEELIDKVELTSKEFPPQVDEFMVAGLTPTESFCVKAPSVKEAKAWLECRLFKHEDLFQYDLIFGLVLCIRAENLDYEHLKPVGRLSDKYCRLAEINS